MEKVALLNRIQNLSSLVHSHDLIQYQLSEIVIQEMKRTLDEITEQYITSYC